MNNRTRAQLQYLAYVKAKFPRLYKAAVIKGGQLSGLGITQAEMLAEQDLFAEPVSSSTSTTPWYQSMLTSAIDTIKELAPAYVGIQQAKTCISVNTERARQGLPPIDCAAAGMTAQAQLNVGVSKEIQYMMIGGLVLVGVYMFTRKR